MPPDGPTALLARLAALAEAMDRIRTAIAADDHPSVVTLLAASRAARAAVPRWTLELTTRPPPTSATELDALRASAAALKRVRAGHQAILAWLSRAPVADRDLLRTPDGAALLAERIITPAWSPEVDVVVLAGEGSGPLARALATRGQRRIVVVRPRLDGEGELPPATLYATSRAELIDRLLAITGAPPSAVSLIRLPCCDLVQEELDALATVIGELTHRPMGLGAEVDALPAMLRRIRNLPAVAAMPSAGALRAAFPGQPLVVVLPGATLAGGDQALRHLAAKAILLATPWALPELTGAGICPDLILLPAPDALPLLAFAAGQQPHAAILGHDVAPDSLRNAARHLVAVPSSAALDHWAAEQLGVTARVADGPSAAAMAVRLALLMRCNPIVLVGDDLLANAANTDITPTTRTQAYLVERWLEHTARAVAPATLLLDGRRNGAPIPGLTRLPAREAAARLPDLAKTVDAVVADLAATTNIAQRRIAMRTHIEELRARLALVTDEVGRDGTLARAGSSDATPPAWIKIAEIVERAAALPVTQVVDLELARRSIDGAGTEPERRAAAAAYFARLDAVAEPLLAALAAARDRC